MDLNIKILISVLSQYTDQAVYIDERRFFLFGQLCEIEGNLVKCGSLSFRCNDLRGLLLSLRSERLLLVDDDTLYQIFKRYQHLLKK